ADARGGAALLRSRAVRQGHAGPEPDPMRFPLLVVGLLVLVLTQATSAQTGNVSRYTLPNGLRLLVREDSSAGVAAVSLQSRAGSRFETPETAGIRNFFHGRMVGGPRTFTGTVSATGPGGLGGTFEPWVVFDSAGFGAGRP